MFYTAGLDFVALMAACAVFAALFALNRKGVHAVWVYGLGGVALWACVLRSGIHPTVAGVALAFVVPMDSTGEKIESALGPWIAWIVLPLFGLANAGLRLEGVTAAEAVDPLILGVFFGLAVGKPIGVFGAARLAERFGWARLPEGLTWAQLFGASILCGIGFTMSLFIGTLAFHGSPALAEAKLAVFAGSLVSAVLGIAFLTIHSARTPRGKRSPSTTRVSP